MEIDAEGSSDEEESELLNETSNEEYLLVQSAARQRIHQMSIQNG